MNIFRTALSCAAVTLLVISQAASVFAGPETLDATTPITPAPTPDAAGNTPPLLKGEEDGTINLFESGKLKESYPPGSIPLTAPGSAGQLRIRSLRDMAELTDEAQQNEEKKEAAAAQKAAEAAQYQQELAEYQAEKKAVERANLKKSAVSILNGNTGDYVKIVPLETLRKSEQTRQVSPQNAAELEKKTVSVFNRETGGYVKGVPVDALAEQPEPQPAVP